ncbi:MAG: bifunctional aldolase/short-chain dehydrogenase [Acidobacteriota bacterium]
MESQWSDSQAPESDDLLGLRVYTSRLLGQDPDLVMHGGGNTSVKMTVPDFFGDPVATLFVKGSGWDLATIEKAGFAPVRLDVLQRLATFERLSDTDMVREQRRAMLDPAAPGPSVEAILHAILPFRFVDHTHADAVVALTNTPSGERRIRDLYGDSVLRVPYVMPGFILARTIWEMTRHVDWSALDGMVLMNHGVFTFHDDARTSYERMVEMVDLAEKELGRRGALTAPAISDTPADVDPATLGAIRRRAGELASTPLLVRLDDSPDARGFAERSDVGELATRGPLTPDHVIRTKRTAAVLGDDPSADLDAFAEAYGRYVEAHRAPEHRPLDPAPRWAVLRGVGTLAFGRTPKELRIIGDITEHTRRAIQWAEHLEAWQALPPREIFDVEYWELEQAKLSKGGAAPPLRGKVAWVTGAASGIGRATADALAARGAAVVGLDLDRAIETFSDGDLRLGLRVDVTDPDEITAAVTRTAAAFGGLDLLVLNAGVFPPSQKLEDLDEETWGRSLDVNVTAHRRVLGATIPLLRHGFDPSVVLVASKNVAAPGPGAAAYSAAKAAATQLARVAALELAGDGVRVNVLHPDAVFDTALWSDDVIAQRAAHYGLTVEAYKTKNLLGVEVRARDVARAVCALATEFPATTGAQIPVDGGNDRVI